jgi:hypothetical protein
MGHHAGIINNEKLNYNENPFTGSEVWRNGVGEG